VCFPKSISIAGDEPVIQVWDCVWVYASGSSIARREFHYQESQGFFMSQALLRSDLRLRSA
jgi:hypothetical protein